MGRPAPVGGIICLRDPAIGTERHRLRTDVFARGLVFSPDGRRLFSTSRHWEDNGPITVWDTESGQELMTLQGGNQDLALSPDGNVLAAVVAVA